MLRSLRLPFGRVLATHVSTPHPQLRSQPPARIRRGCHGATHVGVLDFRIWVPCLDIWCFEIARIDRAVSVFSNIQIRSVSFQGESPIPETWCVSTWTRVFQISRFEWRKATGRLGSPGFFVSGPETGKRKRVTRKADALGEFRGVLARITDFCGYPFQLTHSSLPVAGPLMACSQPGARRLRA